MCSVLLRTMQYDLFWASKLTSIGEKFRGKRSYVQYMEIAKSMTKTAQTFLPGPSAWSLKTCHTSTVGWLYWSFLCVCAFMSKLQALQGSTLLMSLYQSHLVDITLFISQCWCHSIDVTMLTLLRLYHSVDGGMTDAFKIWQKQPSPSC